MKQQSKNIMKIPISKLAVTVGLAQTPHELRPAFKPVLNLKSPKGENTHSSANGIRAAAQSKTSHNAGAFRKSR
jgi:hypothetical protein